MTNYSWPVKAGSLLSQAINALIFGGHPDMSMSTRAYLYRDESRWWAFVRWAADGLFGEGHCYESFCSDVHYATDIFEWEAKK